MNLKMTRLLAVSPLMWVAAASFAADTIAKPEKVSTCAQCHGENGKGQQPVFPNLGGQYENYLLHSLQAYKSGARKNAIMNAQAAALSEDDMVQLATWYSQQEPLIYTPAANSEK